MQAGQGVPRYCRRTSVVARRSGRRTETREGEREEKGDSVDVAARNSGRSGEEINTYKCTHTHSETHTCAVLSHTTYTPPTPLLFPFSLTSPCCPPPTWPFGPAIFFIVDPALIDTRPVSVLHIWSGGIKKEPKTASY